MLTSERAEPSKGPVMSEQEAAERDRHNFPQSYEAMRQEVARLREKIARVEALIEKAAGVVHVFDLIRALEGTSDE